MASSAFATLMPGQFVRMTNKPEWGLGQIQSVVEARATVNFEHAGKILVNLNLATLEIVEDEQPLA